ncbi:MAG: SBBP repeat-containing protein [Chloroflexi bacterium]|nr:SBBP repeat-containing protein [Chloroflexota bacterium]
MKSTPLRIRALSGIAGLCLIFGLVANLLAIPSPAIAVGHSPPLADTPSSLLTFTAGGHVLGFEAGGVYMAGGDHLLRVEFVGTAGVTPVADQPTADAASPPPDRLGLGDRVGLSSSPPLGKVTYAGLWPGISLSYEALVDGIAKSTYFVDPGARVEDIRLRYNAPVEMAEDGSLVFGFDAGEMRESAPVAWQEVEGERVPVAVAFRLLGEREVSFAADEYDRRYPLVVDPELAWNTFLGSSASDYGGGIAVDGNGNAYVVGYTAASWGSPVRIYTASNDAFVAKLDSSGSLQWNTFLGGLGSDIGYGITVDGSGNAYVIGYSQATWGSPVRSYTASKDAFVAKLNSSGVLQWHTFLGGSDSDQGEGIAVDGSGNVYVVGGGWTTWGSPVRNYTANADAFAAKLDSSGTLQWNTFLGGSGNDYGYGIAVDESINIYVAAYSAASWGSPVRTYTAGDDAFVAKLNSSGVLQWNAFLGGTANDYGVDIDLDGSGNAYVVGYSGANWGSPIRSYTADNDAFVAKLADSGSVQWSTFLGGSGSDIGYAIDVDVSGNAYVGGYSYATWGSPIRSYTASNDPVAAKLDSSGNLQWNTFLGGTGSDYGQGIAVDGSGNVYVSGLSNATWGSPVRAYASDSDAFVARISNAATYADPAEACGGNSPCFATLALALGGLLTGGTAYIYGGTYTQSLSFSTNVTATISATVAISGSVSLTTGTLNTNGYTLTVSGDWTNTAGTYSPASGRVIFDKAGTATLSKSGTGSTETFCNLTISRTTTVLDVSDDYIAIADGCALTNNGAIRREAPAQNATANTRLAYNDPLGYPTVALTSTGGTALGSTAITVTIGQTPPSCNGSAFAGTPVKRFYQVTPNATSGVSGTLRLYYAPGEANGTTASNVNLFHCGTTDGWMQVSGTAVRGTDENANKYVELAGVTTFSPFALGEGSPTGVEVSSLAARGLSSGIAVEWETASELNVTGFDVWRAEGDGGDWVKLNEGRVTAEGGSWGNRYRYVDEAARTGRRYQYRLEAVRLGGGSEWYGPVWGSRGWTLYLPMVWR